MKYKDLNLTINQRHIQQISEPKAKRLFDAGEKIYIKPANFRLDCAIEIPINEDFNKYINAFMYYNCNPETGKYIQFFVEL